MHNCSLMASTNHDMSITCFECFCY